jgi:hypothetical protein
VHQVGLKNYRSQYFSFLAIMAEAVGELEDQWDQSKAVQIMRTSTATGRDRWIFFIGFII